MMGKNDKRYKNTELKAATKKTSAPKKKKPLISGYRESDGRPYDGIDPDGGHHYFNGSMLPNSKDS